MFCTFCGKKMDPSKRVCPSCGQPQEPRSGGNGFWDILEDQPKETAATPVPQSAAAPRKTTPPAAAAKGRKKKGSLPRRILSVVTAALLLILMGLEAFAFSERLRLDRKLEELGTEIIRANQRLDTLEQQLAGLISNQEESAPQETYAPIATEASNAGGDTFKVPPQWDAQGCQFYTEYAVWVKDVSWEYMDGQGIWQPISSQDSRFRQTNEAGCSTLKILEEDKELFTQYRCVLLLEDGDEFRSEPVRLLKPQDAEDPQSTQAQS